MGILKQKICILGSFAVGKTSLVERFVNDRFDEKYLTSVGTSVSQKLMPPVQCIHTGQPIQYLFLIWDIAGLEKFDAMVLNYFRGASGALAVADITRPDTIKDLARISEKFLSVSPQAPLVMVGNKNDLLHKNEALPSSLQKLAQTHTTDIVPTSAKTGAGVEDAFTTLSQRIVRQDG